MGVRCSQSKLVPFSSLVVITEWSVSHIKEHIMPKKKKIIAKEEIEKKPVEQTKKQKLWGWFRKNIPTFLAIYARYRGVPI